MTTYEYKQKVLNLLHNNNIDIVHVLMQMSDDTDALINSDSIGQQSLGYHMCAVYNALYNAYEDLLTVEDGIKKGDYLE